MVYPAISRSGWFRFAATHSNATQTGERKDRFLNKEIASLLAAWRLQKISRQDVRIGNLTPRRKDAKIK
jgi:hypothetical protein